jgi:hypothetical protein
MSTLGSIERIRAVESRGRGGFGRISMLAVAMVMVVDLLLLGLLCPFTALFDNFDIIVKYCGDDRDHVGLDHAGADALCAPDTNVDDTLEGEVPFPHTHHIFAATLFEDAD